VEAMARKMEPEELAGYISRELPALQREVESQPHRTATRTVTQPQSPVGSSRRTPSR